MKILFLTSAHNSMSQRALVELTARGHRVSVTIASSDRAMFDAVARERPDLIVSPMLKRAIPGAIWRRHVCLIVHPGPAGDRGASSLDWAITAGAPRWGVTVLQADDEFDAVDIWATHEFPMRTASKSSLYRDEVVEAAVGALLDAVERYARGQRRGMPLDYSRAEVWGRLRPNMKQADRRIDWSAPTAAILPRLRAADSNPGVLDRIDDLDLFLFGGVPDATLRGEPGSLLGWRDGAICRATGDGAIWIPAAKRRPARGAHSLKLPATLALGTLRLHGVPHLPLAPEAHVETPTYREVWYEERGAVGFLHFAFLNGAMSTDQCRRLRAAIRQARTRPTRVLVLLGGPDFWSNGIHLNVIEAAPSAADESWYNINAMNDVVQELLTIEDKLVVSALQGSAGAGGVILALAADQVWARPGVVANPHYQGMGGLYGSEYWTYLLPRRVGSRRAQALTTALQPVGAEEAQAIGLFDEVFGDSRATFPAEVAARAAALAARADYAATLAAKVAARQRDEARKPLAAYRREELARMYENFYGPDPAYHEARKRFVYKLAAPESAPMPFPATAARREALQTA
jgi:putative two-component system hydrogenase maturation factor HypX/HoxX